MYNNSSKNLGTVFEIQVWVVTVQIVISVLGIYQTCQVYSFWGLQRVWVGAGTYSRGGAVTQCVSLVIL